MADETTRLRERAAARNAARPTPARGGAPAFVGKITSASPAAGTYVTVNPVTLTGAETGGAAGTLAANTAQAVPVYLARGTPATGDNLLCRFVDYRWVAARNTAPANPCGINWPRVLTCQFSVAQAQSSFYFNNFPVDGYPNFGPEPLYTLTYQPRPDAVPAALNLLYYSDPGFSGVGPPYFVTVPDHAWFSDAIPVYLFGNPSTVYFYFWFKGCTAKVMVINAPYSYDADGNPLTQGAGNNILSYVVTQNGSGATPFQMRTTPFASTVIVSGFHGSDDVVPDSQGGAGYPTAVRHGP